MEQCWRKFSPKAGLILGWEPKIRQGCESLGHYPHTGNCFGPKWGPNQPALRQARAKHPTESPTLSFRLLVLSFNLSFVLNSRAKLKVVVIYTPLKLISKCYRSYLLCDVALNQKLLPGHEGTLWTLRAGRCHHLSTEQTRVGAASTGNRHKAEESSWEEWRNTKQGMWSFLQSPHVEKNQS